jgi:tetratricopeptide (TPR) repeat protein
MLLSEEGLNRALQLIQTGLDIIGENEILNASLGYVYTQFINVGVSTDEIYLKKAEEHIRKAFSINKDSALAHCIQGQIYWKRADIQKAKKELKRALEIDPTFPEALYWLAWIYQFSGKIFSAKSLLDKLVEIDPLTAVNYLMLGNCELFRGNFKDSLHNYKKAVQMEPRNPLCTFIYTYALLSDQKSEEAFKIVDGMAIQMPEEIFSEIGLLYKRAFQQKKSEPMPLISKKLSGYAARDEMFSIFMADCYALFNENDDAIIWLERGIKWGFINYPFLNEFDPFLENIRGEERFVKLIEKVKIQWENFKI